MRWSLTAYAVPSCWAQSETRYSSSIHRTCRSRAPAGPALGQRLDLVQVGVLEVGDPVHQVRSRLTARRLVEAGRRC